MNAKKAKSIRRFAEKQMQPAGTVYNDQVRRVRGRLDDKALELSGTRRLKMCTRKIQQELKKQYKLRKGVA